MFVFYVFATILIWLGILSLRSGWRFLDFIQRELIKPTADFTPYATIIAPCRNIDQNLEENLYALLKQNYPAYEITFVVDDKQDLSVETIEKVMQHADAKNIKTQLIVAGRAAESSQKVHNLRCALSQISDQTEVLVFVDSDARPTENWLRSLIAPLADQRIGAATGYRWFISKQNNFASNLRSVWNASIASALGENTAKNFCWGGSTAIRRETFEKLEMLEKWRFVASDDFALTNALKAAKMPIYFVPQCLTPSVEDCTFGELLEFSTRQMKITRVYAAPLWKASLIGSLSFSVVFWGGTGLLIWRAFNNLSLWAPIIFLLMILILGTAKAYLRLEAIKLVLRKYEKQLAESAFWHLILWPVTPILYSYNCLAAAFSRRIVWRGINYELKSQTETAVEKSV